MNPATTQFRRVEHRHTSHEHEHDFEVEPGLPQPLPTGEHVLWRGSPAWKELASECFHIRKLAVYFAVLFVWRIWSVVHDNTDLKTAIVPTLVALGLAAAALGIVALLAWLSARTTVYTITDRRVVMRVGIVLSVTFNLPFKRIEAADLRPTRSGHGDIALALDDSTRIAFLHLWPHARPWKITRVQPSLRSIANAAEVAGQLSAAWKAVREADRLAVIALHPVRGEAVTRPAIRPAAQPRRSAVAATAAEAA